jgi:hypothetical protein
MAAFGLTRPGADPAQHPWKEIGHSVEFIGSPVSLLKKSANIGGHIRESRTGGLAWHVDIHVIEIFRAGRIQNLFVHEHLALLSGKTCEEELLSRKHENTKTRKS